MTSCSASKHRRPCDRTRSSTGSWRLRRLPRDAPPTTPVNMEDECARRPAERFGDWSIVPTSSSLTVALKVRSPEPSLIRGTSLFPLVANGIWVILDATCEQWCMVLLFEPSGPRAEQWNVVSTSFILLCKELFRALSPDRKAPSLSDSSSCYVVDNESARTSVIDFRTGNGTVTLP